MQNVTNNFIDLCMSIFNKEIIDSEDKYYIMSFSPKIFHEKFIEKYPFFKNEQQDCIEFIRKLLEDIRWKIIGIKILILIMNYH